MPAAGLLCTASVYKTDQAKLHMDEKGETPKKWYLKKRMFVVYAILGLLFIGTVSSSKSSNEASTGNTQETVPETAITVTASKLTSDYKDNEVSADAKYKDKLLEISGTVDTIGKDVLDTPYIAFRTDNEYEIVNRVQCMFGKDDIATLSNVTKGQKITLRGTGAGKLGNIVVNGCKIVK